MHSSVAGKQLAGGTPTLLKSLALCYQLFILLCHTSDFRRKFFDLGRRQILEGSLSSIYSSESKSDRLSTAS
jgi:hypothetical protein